MNEMTGLRIEVASLWDEPARKGPKGRRSARWAISHQEKSIAKTQMRWPRILTMNMVLGFRSLEPADMKGFS
jgi:hypothetical protein